MNSYQNLSLADLAIAASLILINGALSIALKLGLERRLAWAAFRTVAQLLLIGYLLDRVFAFDRWYVVLPVIAVMTLIAGLTASNRGKRTYSGPADRQRRVDLGEFVAGGRGLPARHHPRASVV